MEEVFNYEFVNGIIERYFDYKYGKYIFEKINSLDIAENTDLVFPKNLDKTDSRLELYVFKANKIYKIFLDEKDEEVVKFKIIKKSDIDSIEFSVNYDNEYCAKFSGKNHILDFKFDDVIQTYELKSNNTIKKIIEYFNE